MKLAAAFWKDSGKNDGLMSQCKECSVGHKAPATKQKVPPRPQTPPWIYLLWASQLLYMGSIWDECASLLITPDVFRRPRNLVAWEQ